MKSNYQVEFETIAKRIQRDTLTTAIDKLFDRLEMYNKIMENGRPIFEMAYGQRFNRLYQQRSKVWDLCDHYNSVISMLIELQREI